MFTVIGRECSRNWLQRPPSNELTSFGGGFFGFGGRPGRTPELSRARWEQIAAFSRGTLVLLWRVVRDLRNHTLLQRRERELAGLGRHDQGLVFARRNGRPIDRRDDYDEWIRILDAAGVRRVRLHDARHSVATTLLEQGVPARVVADLLGHSQTKITLDTYSHLLPAMAAEAACTMQAALFDSDDEPTGPTG